MYLSVRLTDEEIQGYPLIDGDDHFNGQRERAAIDFAYELKERHPRNTVAIVVVNEAPESEPSPVVRAARDLSENVCDSLPLTDDIRTKEDVLEVLGVLEAHAQTLREAIEKEENVEAEQIKSTVVVTDAEVAAGAKKIRRGLEEWEAGRMASPDQRDYVIECCHVLGIDYGNYPLEIDEIAEEIFEDAGQELVTVEAIAKYALTRLKEYDLKCEEPKSEYLVHLNIQLSREKRIEVEQLEREISGALEVGLGSEEYAPGLQGAEVEIALAEEIG